MKAGDGTMYILRWWDTGDVRLIPWESQCEAVSPSNRIRCTNQQGHGRVGNHRYYDHAAPEFGVWWNIV